MIYTKVRLNGIEMNVEIDPNELFCKCVECGREIKLDDEWLNHIVKEDDFLTLFETGYLCAECSREHVKGDDPNER